MRELNQISEFDDFVNIYDADIGDRQTKEGDVEFYSKIATAETHGTILDVGCGNGRVAIPLIVRGFDVEGFDISMKMIDECRERISLCAKPCDRYKFLQRSVNEWVTESCSKEFSMIIAAYNVFFHILGKSYKADFIDRAHERLMSGGLLIIDVFQQRLVPLLNYENILFFDHAIRINDGIYIKRFKKIKCDFIAHQNEIEYTYISENCTGIVDIQHKTQTLQYVSAVGIVCMLKNAGFNDIVCYGNYAEKLFDYSVDDKRMLFVARKD